MASMGCCGGCCSVAPAPPRDSDGGGGTIARVPQCVHTCFRLVCAHATTDDDTACVRACVRGHRDVMVARWGVWSLWLLVLTLGAVGCRACLQRMFRVVLRSACGVASLSQLES
jgi:hypothetical protein